MDGRAETPEEKEIILEILGELWDSNPHLRFGQLIGNVFHSADPGGVALYYMEDFDLVAEMQDFYDGK